jgi:mannosyl-oligosaccharide alpha-1,2-mannosidase
MDHLVCFIGGNFVLGVTEGASLDEKKELSPVESEDVSIGKEITRTCYEMYNMTATGLASEIVYFNTNPDAPADAADMEIHRLDKHNLLRPETLETLFLMWRLTGDEIYR